MCIRYAAAYLGFLVDQWNIDIYDRYMKANAWQKNEVAIVPDETIASDAGGSPGTIYSWGV